MKTNETKQSLLRRWMIRLVLRSLRDEFVLFRNPKQRFFRRLVVKLWSKVTSHGGALAPMIRIVQERSRHSITVAVPSVCAAEIRTSPVGNRPPIAEWSPPRCLAGILTRSVGLGIVL